MQVANTNRLRRAVLTLGALCLVLQLALAPSLALGGGQVNFALVFCGIVALSTGGRAGVLAGFAAGLLFDLCTTGPIGLMALLLTVGSFVMGMECRNRLADDRPSAVALFLTTSLGVLVLYQLAMLLVGQASSFADALFLRAIPSFVLTGLVFLLASRVMSPTGKGAGGKYDLGGV